MRCEITPAFHIRSRTCKARTAKSHIITGYSAELAMARAPQLGASGLRMKRPSH
jgi:hypothetical protein